MKPKTFKTIDKALAWTERIKDPVVYANEKVKDATDGQANVLDYGEDKIKYVSNRIITGDWGFPHNLWKMPLQEEVSNAC